MRTELLLQEITLSSGELHSQSPDSSTEDRFLSVLKNNVSDTRGTELLLQEISLGFLQVFLFEQFLGISDLMIFNPSNSRMFSYDSREIQNSLTKTTLQIMLYLEMSSGRYP